MNKIEYNQSFKHWNAQFQCLKLYGQPYLMNHALIDDKRVANKLGVGKFNNVYGISGNNVTAGQKDYAARMLEIEKQREEYYKSLGTPPGVPTMKGATADPDNTGRGYNDIIGDLGDHSVPEGWGQRPKFNDKGDVPGPPIQWQKPEDPDNAQPGYGYISTDTTNVEDIFFYHSDHLGSTSCITDAKANITQFDAYLPYGELLVDEHSSTEEMPYKFNGKELDQETGLYYYGARYMNPLTSLWYGVDPMTEKYPNISAYLYCHANPVKFIDPTGMDDIFDKNGNFIKDTGKGSLVLIQDGGQTKLLSSYDYSESNTNNRNMLAKVSTYYLRKSDKEPFEIKLSNNDPLAPEGAVFSNTTGTGTYNVELSNGKINKSLDNKYIFESMTFHESRHRYDSRTWGGGIGEVEAIIMQTSHK